MVVVTAIVTAAICLACGASAGQPATQVVDAPAQPTQVMVGVQPTVQVVEKSLSYWAKAQNKAFKAIEYGCTQAWKEVGMPTGCVVVIDRAREGWGHNGLTGPFGIVIPFDTGVTIKTGWDRKVYVPAKAATYTFVLLDESDFRIVQSFSNQEGLWDEGLLLEFFNSQMGGDVDTIWREGVSDIK